MDQDNSTKALSPGHPLSGERVRRIPRLTKTLKMENEKRIGTWNVRSLYQAEKAINVVREMQRLNIDILGCSEVRWPDSGHCTISDYHIYYSGDTT